VRAVITPAEIRVRVADYAVASGNRVIATVGLGSCVAIALYDPEARVGGLAHILLPSPALSWDHRNRAKFAGTAVPLLLEEMQAVGARLGRVRAKLAGGASMFAPLSPGGGLPMGERNVLAAREALRHAGIVLVAQDVGGGHGRSVFLDTTDGRLTVKSLARGNVVL
jgi:chemotaxis protein CheD